MNPIDREVDLKIDECIVCNSNNIKSFYPALLKCHDCGYVFSDIQVTDEELFAFYGRKYFFGNEYNNYVADKKVIQKNFKSRLKVINKFIDPSRHNYIFEIGSAYGFFLDVAKNSFEIVRGMDISEDGIRYAQEELRLDAIHADFLKYDFGEQKFDMVCMWDTIEHLKHPHLYLDKIGKHMDCCGLLALTTGDIESLNARIRKDKWRFLKPPEHIHYFSRTTITKILDKYGFDVVYNRYCGNYMSIENVANKLLVLNNNLPWLYNLYRKTNLCDHYFYLNFFDIMFVIAVKR